MSMTPAISNDIIRLNPVGLEPTGKFTAFRDWIKDNKRGIAIAFLVVGIAAIVFGAAVLISLMPITHFQTFQIIPFVAGLFKFKGIWVSGLSTKGKLFFAAIGSIVGGALFTGYGSGILSAIPKRN
jgi:hypothetical protein